MSEKRELDQVEGAVGENESATKKSVTENSEPVTGAVTDGEALERIKEAIRALKSWSGSSYAAIMKHLGDRCPEKETLKKTLKQGVESGALTKRKQSYLVAGDPEYPDPTPRIEIVSKTRPEGGSDEVKKNDICTINYTGKLANGEQFDAGELTFILGAGDVIKGMDQGVMGMVAGEKRTVKIPPSLGYGNRAQGGIPAGSELIFDFELTEVGNKSKLMMEEYGDEDEEVDDEDHDDFVAE